MKFCDRPDTSAFPHVIILTVKILNSNIQEQNKNMGSVISKPNSPESTENSTAINLEKNYSLSKTNKDDQKDAEPPLVINGHSENHNVKIVPRVARRRSRLQQSVLLKNMNSSSSSSLSR